MQNPLLNSLEACEEKNAQNQTLVSHRFLLPIVLQRDPAEEALKSNNMNLDQAMSKFTNIFVPLCVNGKELISYAFTKSDCTTD